MKRFLKRFTTLLLILVMLLEIAPVSAFAGGGGGGGGSSIVPTIDHTAANFTVTRANLPGNAGHFMSGHVGRSEDTANMQSYILAVSLGLKQDVVIDSVVISYYSDAENESKGLAYHQVLEVNRKEGDVGINNAILEGVNAIYDTSQNWPFYGSKYATFRSIVGDATSASSSYYTVGDRQYRKNFSSYANWAKSLVPDVDTKKFPSAAEKYEEAFPAFSTEYIRFRLEYNLYTLVSVEFIVSKGDGPGLSGEFAINGWSLFKETTRKENGKTVSAGLSATNYAFMSNRLGLTFSGTPLGRSTDIANTKTNTGVVVTKNSSIKYFNKYAKVIPVDKLDKKEEFPNEGKYDVYRTDTLDGNLVTLCCTCTPADLTNVSAPSLEIFNFEIALADVYEGGIEGFNVVKGLGEKNNALNLHDMLIANIVYVDSYGILQTLSVPVISNALLEYGIPVDANLSQSFIDAVQKGQYVSFAQQGDKLYFSVEFPGVQKINSINLSYFNPVNLNDQVAISSIAIYSNWEVPNACRQKLQELEKEWNDADAKAKEAESTAKNYYLTNNVPKKGERGFKPMNEEQMAERDSMFRILYTQAQTLRATANNKKSARDAYAKAIGGADQAKSTSQYSRRDLYKKESGEHIAMDVGESNLMLYLSTNPETIWLDNGTLEYEFEMKDVSQSPSENLAIPNRTDFKDMYLVSLTSSNIGVASTVDDLYFSLEYIDNQDNKQETSEVLVQEAAQDYAGYVAGVVTKDTRGATGAKLNTAVDVAYYYGMNHSNTIYFLVKARNVKQFTAANFKLGDSEDEWQMSNMTITKIESYGKRQYVKLNTTNYTSVTDTGEVDFSLNHTYTRNVVGERLYNGDIVMLLQRKGTGHIDLIKGTTETTHEKRQDYEDYEYSMTYEMATTDLKFDTTVQDYEVRVKVAPNSSNSVNSDNSGSNNMFYFQLVFKNQKRSAYVLANKQLSSDGFRSGVTESFIISTNTDCGDVSAVYVIADDISSNSAPLDKLNVEAIEVIKKNSNVPDKRFVAENIGWISTGYIDTSEATERKPRAESELANSFAIQYSAYMIGLEVAMAYGPYDEGMPQFEGNMTADLYYENSAGEAKSIRDIDVVKAMYDYMNKTARISTENKKSLSDTDYMFRAEHVDRFIIDVEDCVKIKRLVFHGDPIDNTAVAFKDIKISALRSQGSLAINDEGEFYKVYSKDLSPILVAELATTPKSSYQFSYGQNNLASFYLSSEEFPEFGESTNMSAMISRVPDSADDIMNLYIFLSDGTDFPGSLGYDVLATVKYKSTVDNRVYVSQVENRKDTNRHDFQETTINGQKVIYKTGISAPNFSAISSINLYCNDWTKNLSADKAMIQQVRRGVVINTFDVPLPGHVFSVQNGASASFAYSATDSYNTQQVKMILSGNTPTVTLTPEENDVAVRFHYKSKALGVGEYTSKWVFASDNGTTAIHPGSELTFDFNEYGVGEITMIEVQCSGGVIAYIDTTDGVTGISAICREGDKAVTPVEVSRYSFYTKGETKLSAVIQRFNAEKPLPSGNNILKNVQFAFKTKSTSTIVDSGGSAPIKATINYLTSNENKEIVIDDIRNYISTSNTSGVFAEGRTANVSLMLPGFEGMYSITLEPKDSNPSTTARWNLESVSYKAEGIADESTHTISVDHSIAEGNPYTIEFVEKQNVITNGAIE